MYSTNTAVQWHGGLEDATFILNDCKNFRNFFTKKLVSKLSVSYIIYLYGTNYRKNRNLYVLPYLLLFSCGAEAF